MTRTKIRNRCIENVPTRNSLNANVSRVPVIQLNPSLHTYYRVNKTTFMLYACLILGVVILYNLQSCDAMFSLYCNLFFYIYNYLFLEEV